MNFMTRRGPIEKQKLLDDVSLGVWIVCNERPDFGRKFSIMLFDALVGLLVGYAVCASNMIVSFLTMIRISILTSAIAKTMGAAVKGCSGWIGNAYLFHKYSSTTRSFPLAD